jgi:hypothetical protein
MSKAAHLIRAVPIAVLIQVVLALEMAPAATTMEIAEQLAEFFLVPRDAVVLDQREKIRRCEPGERGLAKVRAAGGDVIGRACRLRWRTSTPPRRRR